MTPDGVNVKLADKLWIGGRWVTAHSGRMIELISPNTEQVVGAVAEADAHDMDAAVAAARAAFDTGPWSRMRPAERVALLKRMADHLRARAAENESRIAQEEIFGPVLSLIPVEDEEDAIRAANESNYGLNGSVLTNDADAAYRIARRIRTGAVGQNGLRMDFGLPYGGFKQSGVGREGGIEGLIAYLETKTILLDAAPREL